MYIYIVRIVYIVNNICIALTLPKGTSTECHWCFCGVPRVLQVKMQMAKSHNDVTKMIDVFSQVVVVILRYSHRQRVRNSGTSCSLYMEGLSLSTISAIVDHAICSYIIIYLLCLGANGCLVSLFAPVCTQTNGERQDKLWKHIDEVKLFSFLGHHWDMDVSKNCGTPKWMVYNGKPY